MKYSEMMKKEADRYFSVLREKASDEQFARIETIKDELYQTFCLSDFAGRFFSQRPDVLDKIINVLVKLKFLLYGVQL